MFLLLIEKTICVYLGIFFYHLLFLHLWLCRSLLDPVYFYVSRMFLKKSEIFF